MSPGPRSTESRPATVPDGRTVRVRPGPTLSGVSGECRSDPADPAQTRPRRTERTPFDHAFVTDGLMTHHGVSTKEPNYQFPLYLYPEAGDETYSELDNPDRDTNINGRVLSQLSDAYGEPVSAEEVFYYTYAVLYTPQYRLKYSEFMESDFPKIPFAEDADVFKQFSELGQDLTEYHLLTHSDLGSPGVKFEGTDGNEVSDRTGEYNRHYDAETERCYVNADQYFTPVPQDVWEYEIGDRPVAKKWIQNRIGETLSSSDIRKFCRIIRALMETIDIQNKLNQSWEAIESNYLTFELDGQQTLDT